MIKSMQLFVATTCILVFPTGLASDVAVQVAKQKSIREAGVSVCKYEDKKEQKYDKDDIRIAKLSKITTTKKIEEPKKVEKKEEKVEEPKTEAVIAVAKEEPQTNVATETKKIATETSVTSRSSNSVSANNQANTTSKKTTKTKSTTNKNTTKKITSTANKTTSTTNKSTSTTKNTSNTKQQTTNASKDWVWTGKKLTRSAGVVPAGQTPSGYRETYYNLNMSGCLKAMKLPASGMSVRADGVKTYNGYVMVASPNLKAYPKGSYIKTTLGMGYVVDFCPSGSLDIAVAW